MADRRIEANSLTMLWRWTKFVVIQLAVSLVALEALSVLLYPLLFDRPYSRSRIQAELSSKQALATTSDTQTDDGDLKFIRHDLHPYLGFVTNPELVANVNPLGFWGETPLMQRAEGRVNVALLGGSLAVRLFREDGDTLVQALSRAPALRGKDIRLSCLAIAGYKQPQQLLALSFALYLGAEFDIVINLDGFNEVVLPLSENSRAGIPPYFPRAWNLYSEKSRDLQDSLAMASLVSRQRDQNRLANRFGSSIFAKSNFALIVWDGLNRRHEADIQQAYLALVELREKAAAEASSGAPSGTPGALSTTAETLSPDGNATGWPIGSDGALDLEAYFRESSEAWVRGSLLIQDFSERNGFRYFHFLQPNQYVENSKVFTNEEKQIADLDAFESARTQRHRSVRSYKSAASAGYPFLIAAGERLVEAGVRFTDLTMVFADVTETVYQDSCCHVNRRGNEIIANSIAEIIGVSETKP